ncbi:metallophosphoesterase family protein [Dyadobacter sp. LJ53]|uniref:purple acid phosphatase family protein n=1 Tax=Dyadobacter chenwenxiniae TaxID=2906456 RepID=UPI001F4156B9|nr:metallophosphoesterase family protein [Dyadobacter chenwenxiniae]MCF0052465.1 metallophosphoesterase family protein [Dyadobacter chenwenxiniae]
MKKVKLLLLTLLLPILAIAQETQPVKKPVAKKKGPLMGIQADLLRGPYLQMATPTSMTVRWRTNVYDRSRVKYGLSADSLTMRTDDSTLVNEHIVTLKDLKPSTKYFYTVGNLADTTLQGDEENYFYTFPETGSEQLVRIAGFGDCGNNSINQRSVRDQVVNYLGDKYLNAWILMGDNAYSDGTDAEFQAKFFNLYKDNLLKKYPLYPVPGNHDYHDFNSSPANDQNKIAYYQNFSLPTQGEAGGVASNTESYYSYDIANIHFLALDSYGPDKKGTHIYDQMGEQVEWVKKDLAANQNKKWVVAYWHHPPYTMGSHDSDKESLLVKIRENFIKTLEDGGVDLILCGHSHVYERTKLIKGYYGKEADYDAKKYEISSSTALYDGSKNSAPYLKSKTKTDGTVYVVSGSAGALGGHKETWPHNAMYYSNNEVGGAVMLEVEGNRLDLKWICSDGKIGDHFTMMKDVKKEEEKTLKQDKKLTK